MDQKSGDLERLKKEPSPEIPLSLTVDDDNQDFIEGYGDDRDSTLEAFPFSQQSSAPVSEDVELRKKLKNMGKASRKQFAALARRFFLKRRKKTAQQMYPLECFHLDTVHECLRGTQAPSMVNLLDEDEDGDVEERPAASEELGLEGYNQISDTQRETDSNLQNSPQPRRHFDVV
ncbi:cue domain-containing protein 1 [Plakobranchus ocellatus]|uniref:Cue domain-containing protein 1 n=1 Tax=Plakobranchus ocellatus TaxID=259542 RepID=A0AAV4AVH9_9GAST|nr:cue domain-containing protein 1 [Plakobranchus ocellatus]